MPKTSQVKLSMAPGQVRPYALDESKTTPEVLSSLGINATPEVLARFISFAQDADPSMVSTATVTNPIQFFQYFIPGAIRNVTQARKIDDILGRDIAGQWGDEEIVRTFVERTGQPRPYGDKTNLISTDWNQNFERRTIVRFESGIEVGALEEYRASVMKINSAAEKREAVAEGFAIEMNNIGFSGYNDGSNRTYGILNDPNLPSYVTVATGTGGYTWAEKTFLEIVADIKTAMAALRVRSGYNFDPYKDACCLAIAGASVDQLATLNTLGTISVREWIAQTYPGCRIEVAPQFSAANSSANVFYLIAETLAGVKVVNQYIQDTFRMLGVERKAKGFLEAHSCSTAGVLVGVPIGLVRYTGI